MSDVSKDDIAKISDDVAWKILTYSTVTGPNFPWDMQVPTLIDIPG